MHSKRDVRSPVRTRPLTRTVTCALPSRARRVLLVLGIITAVLLVVAAMTGLAGCSQQIAPAFERPVQQSVPVQLDELKGKPRKMKLADAGRKRSLLFLPVAGLTVVPPRAFGRADWPTTPGSYSLGETVYYRLWWYDRQRIGRHGQDYGWRRFEYSRAGVRYNY